MVVRCDVRERSENVDNQRLDYKRVRKPIALGIDSPITDYPELPTRVGAICVFNWADDIAQQVSSIEPVVANSQG